MGALRTLVLIRLIQWPVRALLRATISRVSRDPQLIAFGCPLGKFADNAAYLFVHMSAEPDFTCVWISGSRATVERLRAAGLHSELRWSLRGIWVAVRASWYVFTQSRADVNTLLADGAIEFNLWHGLGVKRIGRSMNHGWKQPVFTAPEGSIKARLFADDRHSPDWFLSTSPPMTAKFAAAYALAPEQCPQLGYPRVDHLLERRDAPAVLAAPGLIEAIGSRSPVVGYFPTFRDESPTIPGGPPIISEMARIVAAQGGVLVFKAHDRTTLDGQAVADAVVLARESDLNAVLHRCDILITDFSSVVNDFVLLDRPIVHYWPDPEAFSGGRGFTFDPSSMAPGVIVRDTSALYEMLADLASIPNVHDRERIIAHFWGDTARPRAAARIAHFIAQQGDGAAAGTRVRRR
jgi:CDP-glycerol glycerophosphotransferase (TagB/SpsB family)